MQKKVAAFTQMAGLRNARMESWMNAVMSISLSFTRISSVESRSTDEHGKK